MKREKKQQNKTMLISDVMKYMSCGHTLDETTDYADWLCDFYFPKADEIFRDCLRCLVMSIQDLYWTEDSFDRALREYK